MEISREDIERFAQLQKAGKIDDDYFQDLAIDKASKKAGFQLEGAVTVLTGFLAFALFNIPGLIMALLGGGGVIAQKILDSRRETNLILEGDHKAIASNLPDGDRKNYTSLLAKKAVAIDEGSSIDALFGGTGAKGEIHHTHTVTFDVPENFWGKAKAVVDAVPPVRSVESVATPAPGRGDDRPSPQPIKFDLKPQATPPAKPSTPAPAAAIATKVDTDIAARLVERGVMSTLMVGGSGTGKSLTVSTTLKRLKRATPGLKLWVISAKCEAEESGYWSGFDRFSFYDFLTCSKEMKFQAFKTWYNILADFKAMQQAGILLLDELSLILMAADRYKDKCEYAAMFVEELVDFMVSFSSAGRSRSKAVWGITPTGALTSLPGFNRGTLGAFYAVFNTRLKGDGFSDLVYKGAETNKLCPSYEPRKSDTQRAIENECTLLTGLEGEWHPCKQYPTPPEDPAIIKLFQSDRGPYASQTQTVITGEPTHENITNSDRPTIPTDDASNANLTTVIEWGTITPDVPPAALPTSDVMEPGVIPGEADFELMLNSEYLQVLSGVMAGKGKVAIAAEFGHKPGETAGYKRISDHYDQAVKAINAMEEKGGF